MAFPSVYEMTNPLTTVRKQHFWEYFSGSKLQDITGALTQDYSLGVSSDWVTTNSTKYNYNAGGYIYFDAASTQQDARISRDLGVTLSDTAWVMRWKQNITNYAQGSEAQHLSLAIGLSKDNVNASTNTAFIGLGHASNSGVTYYKEGHNTSGTLSGVTGGTSLSEVPAANVRYVEMIRKNATQFSIRITANSDYTGGSFIDNQDCTGIADLRYVVLINNNTQVAGSARWTGQFSDMKIWNGTASTSGTTPIRWKFNDLSGTGGLVRMQNAVNEGIYLQSGTSSSADRAGINFNNKRLFSHDSSVSIVMGKESGGSIAYFGLGNIIDPNQSSPTNISVHRLQNNGYYFQLKTADNTSASTQDSTVSPNSGFHVFKIINGSSNISSSIDGIVQTTKTSNRPTLAMQPILAVEGQGGNCKIRYMECFNT